MKLASPARQDSIYILLVQQNNVLHVRQEMHQRKYRLTLQRVQMDDHGRNMMKNTGKELFAESREILSWEWDSRFGMALAQFSVDDAEQVRKVLEKYLRVVWNSSDIDQSPEAVRTVVDSLGGLLPGQFLFTSPPEEIFLLCAWWPWNNGQTVSVRVTYHGADLTHDERGELTRFIQSQFA